MNQKDPASLSHAETPGLSAFARAIANGRRISDRQRVVCSRPPDPLPVLGWVISPTGERHRLDVPLYW